jgi:CRISPR-associated protein Csb2
VRIRWPDEVKVRGPVVIGGGRYCGFGLFAAMK